MAWMADGTMSIIELKFGRSPVLAAPSNIQLAAYAVAAHQDHGAKAITCHIVQPRIAHHSTHTFVAWPEALETLERIVEKCEDPFAALRPGAEQCKYCRAFEVCPAVRDGITHQIERIEKLVPMSTMTAAEIARLVDDTAPAVRFHALAKSALRERLEAGESAPGWEVRPGRKSRSADPQALWEACANALTPGDYIGCCKVSVPKVMAAYAATIKEATSKAEAKRQAEAALSGAINISQGRPVVCRVGETEEGNEE
jgi:hypothetical protein